MTGRPFVPKNGPVLGLCPEHGDQSTNRAVRQPDMFLMHLRIVLAEGSSSQNNQHDTFHASYPTRSNISLATKYTH